MLQKNLIFRLTVIPACSYLTATPAFSQQVNTTAPKISARELRQGCAEDPLHIANTKFVQLAVHALGLTKSIFQFIGCPKTPFKVTNGFAHTNGGRTFTIYYRTTIRSTHLGTVDYVAPIVHELSHAYQIALSGGLGPLQQTYCSERRELGADYLTGFLFRNYLHNVAKSNFQHNLNLLGAYIETTHGEPPDRTQAFRSGYEVAQVVGLTTIDEAYEYFQAIRFREIASRYPKIWDRCR